MWHRHVFQVLLHLVLTAWHVSKFLSFRPFAAFWPAACRVESALCGKEWPAGGVPAAVAVARTLKLWTIRTALPAQLRQLASALCLRMCLDDCKLFLL
jgi:hypothetical protein